MIPKQNFGRRDLQNLPFVYKKLIEIIDMILVDSLSYTFSTEHDSQIIGIIHRKGRANDTG